MHMHEQLGRIEILRVVAVELLGLPRTLGQLGEAYKPLRVCAELFWLTDTEFVTETSSHYETANMKP